MTTLEITPEARERRMRKHVAEIERQKQKIVRREIKLLEAKEYLSAIIEEQKMWAGE